MRTHRTSQRAAEMANQFARSRPFPVLALWSLLTLSFLVFGAQPPAEEWRQPQEAVIRGGWLFDGTSDTRVR
ncbi:MAG: hypothetical protein ACE5MM_08360, partial [Nitrospiraceae bacterium]